jgi:hypothetical protein
MRVTPAAWKRAAFSVWWKYLSPAPLNRNTASAVRSRDRFSAFFEVSTLGCRAFSELRL